MTGYQSKKKAASAKTIDQVNWVDHEPDSRRAAQEPVAWAVYDKRGGSKSLHWPEQHSPDGDATMFDAVPLYTPSPAAQPAQERNFCSRCGKRTADLTTIHTCTPPQEKNNG